MKHISASIGLKGNESQLAKVNQMKMLNFFVAKLPDFLYAILKNLHFLMQKKDIRYVSRDSMIEIRDTNLLWTTHRSRAHLYSNGFYQRGAAIGKSYLLDHIDFTDGDLVVDCGANMGDLQLWFRNEKFKIKYLGIEPNPIDFVCLSKNLLSDSSCLNLALWNENGSLKFWVDSKSASSSLIQPPYFTEIINVKASRFDELENLERIKLLKVEGEGAEPEILFGAKRFLKNIQFISADLGPERGVEQTSTRNEVVNFLLENNFTVVIENPYHRKTVLFKNSEYSR